jgi:uncharacterized protein
MAATRQTAALPPSSCTAFDGARRAVSGSYVQVAIALKEYIRKKSDASILIFDDTTGKQIDFDLRGTDQEIAERIRNHYPENCAQAKRPAGRPRLGVISREVTLMPHHWEWLAEEPGGASASLRRLVEIALRTGPSEMARLRRIHERTYCFMSAIAGNFPNFEEASRALFASNIPGLKKRICKWPPDIRRHILNLCADIRPTGSGSHRPSTGRD